MKGLLRLSGLIDLVNGFVGRKVAWLILVAVVVAAVNALVRKIFNVSSNAWLELQWMLFGAVFLMCASWTMQVKEHIRIDIVNSLLPRRVRQWIELLGHLLFLMPFCVLIVYHSWPFFLRSWEIDEQSLSAGGLPQWPAKALVMIGFALLFVQGISELIKRISIMRGLIPDPHASQTSTLEAEVEHIVEAVEKR